MITKTHLENLFKIKIKWKHLNLCWEKFLPSYFFFLFWKLLKMYLYAFWTSFVKEKKKEFTSSVKWNIPAMHLIYLFSEASLVAQMVKHLPAMQETRVRSLGQEDSPREGNGTPLQYSCLENSMDRRDWRATVHGVAKSLTRLRDFTFFHWDFRWRRKWHPTPVFFLAWEIPWTEETGGLQHTGSQRVRHDWSD